MISESIIYSDVVRLTRKDHIGIISMEERSGKNMFTDRLIQGLKTAFNAVEKDSNIKVVVLHGYDNYFCSGGTKESLLSICKGDIDCFHGDFFSLPLKCEIPVISAMQGHALGGGLAFGCYGDIIILSEEARYSATFMKFGFTPGMGATLIIPDRFGKLLGTEMLYRATLFSGLEIKKRGSGIKIVKQTDVIPTAMKTAGDFSDKPLISLKLLKKRFSDTIRSTLPEVIREELRMHEQTFHSSEVQSKIEALFG